MDSKQRLLWIAVITGLSLLLLGGCRMHRKARSEAVVKAADNPVIVETKPTQQVEKSADEIDLPVKQEVRQSYKLAPNATVSIAGVNGLLEVETSDTDKAEIYIVRSVRQQDDFNDRDLMIETQSDKLRIVRSTRNQDDFNDRNLLIEQVNDKLRIRVQQQRQRSFWSLLTPRSEERQRAYLKLPRQIQLDAAGVNGVTRIGEIGGRVALRGINGPIAVARASGGAELSGINGNIEITLEQLTKGVSAHGINGNLDLRFAGEVNADLAARGINGNVEPELPNVKVTEQRRGRMEARIGQGGAPIDLSGINGNIRLLPVTVAQTAKPEAAAKSAAR